MVNESVFSRFDAQQFGRIVADVAIKVLADMDIPLDEFPYKTAGVTIEPGSDAEEFTLQLNIAEGKAVLKAEMTVDELLRRPEIFNALSEDAILTLVNALERWLNERCRRIENDYKEDPEKRRWYLAEPDLLRKRKMLKDLDMIFKEKTE